MLVVGLHHGITSLHLFRHTHTGAHTHNFHSQNITYHSKQQCMKGTYVLQTIVHPTMMASPLLLAPQYQSVQGVRST